MATPSLVTRGPRPARAWDVLREQADRRVLWAATATLVLCAGGGALSALTPVALKQLIDAVSVADAADAATSRSVWVAGAVYLMSLCAARVSTDLRPLLSGIVNQRMEARLSRRFLDQVMSLPIGYLLKRKGGELMHSLGLATTGSQLVVGHLLNSLVPVLVELATMTVVLVQLRQPALLATFGVGALLYLVVFGTAAIRTAPHARAVSAASLTMYGQLGDAISNVEAMRCFSADDQARSEFQGAGVALENAWIRLFRLNTWLALAATAVFTACMGVGLELAARAVAMGTLTAGGFVLASLYMLQMVRPLEVLGSAARDISRAMGFLRPLVDLLALPLDAAAVSPTGTDDSPGPSEEDGLSLSFRGVRFGYEPARPVLENLDLDVRAGKTTAIVGRSGCGKSTLVRLIMRLHAPQSGTISLGGHPIDQMPVDDLRGRIGLVPQETTLMHTTIARNIALGRPHAERREIEDAAEAAGLQPLLRSLPAGHDTVVGERGLLLSGGERQRIAIARALLRRPRLLVLDEPTSMLDAQTEADIHDTLTRHSAGRTTLVIAHRLTTIRHADEIVVLEGGRVRERGQHDDLIERGGLYAQLWRQQTTGLD